MIMNKLKQCKQELKRYEYIYIYIHIYIFEERKMMIEQDAREIRRDARETIRSLSIYFAHQESQVKSTSTMMVIGSIWNPSHSPYIRMNPVQI